MNRNLQLRIIFGLLYAAVIVGGLYYSQWTAIALLSILGFLMLWEFNDIAQSIRTDGFKMTMKLINIPLAALVVYLLKDEADIYPLLTISIAYSLFNAFSLFTKKTSIVQNDPHWFHMILYITLPITMAIMCCLWFENFHHLLLYVFFIVWLCDVGAYFAGKGFGKNKLFPSVSPGKTWEGFIGGVLAGILVAVAIHYVFGHFSLGEWIILGIVVSLTSVVGDLVESSFKRYFKVKDSSNIIPGHGGFLDRLDSFIYALPFYILLIIIFVK